MKGRYEKRWINRHKKDCFLLNVFFKVHFYFSHIPDYTDEISAHWVSSPHQHLALWQLWVLQRNASPSCLEDILEVTNIYWVCGAVVSALQIACHLNPHRNSLKYYPSDAHVFKNCSVISTHFPTKIVFLTLAWRPLSWGFEIWR